MGFDADQEPDEAGGILQLIANDFFCTGVGFGLVPAPRICYFRIN